MEIIAYQILPPLLETVEIMTACLVEMVAGELLFYSFLLSSDGETTAGAIMATAADIQPQQLLRQTFREDLTIPQ